MEHLKKDNSEKDIMANDNSEKEHYQKQTILERNELKKDSSEEKRNTGKEQF